MKKQKEEPIKLVTDKIAMTPDEVTAKYYETHTEDGKQKDPTTTPAEPPEPEPTEAEEREQEPEQKPIDLEQLKKNVASAIATLTDVQAILNQLVIIPDDNINSS